MTARISRRAAFAAPLVVAAPAAGSGAFAAAREAVRPYESGAATARMCDAAIMEWNARQDAAVAALAEVRATTTAEAAARLEVIFGLLDEGDTWLDMTRAEAALLRSVHADLLQMGGAA